MSSTRFNDGEFRRELYRALDDKTLNLASAVIWAQFKGHNHAVDWMAFEGAQRAIFRMVKDEWIDENAALILISELLGAATGRGTGF
jgi:hypothetical protein